MPIHPEILRKSAVEALEEVKSDNHKHTFVIENAEDLQDILNRIASGEFDEKNAQSFADDLGTNKNILGKL